MGTAMSEGRLFSKTFTLGLACFLLVPAGLSALTELEPFPAVMLPGGGDPLRVRGGVATFTDLSLSGKDQHGKLRRLVVNEFIDPIPEQYVHAMLSDGFGLSDPRPVPVKLGGFQFRVPRRTRSKQAHEDLVAWLRARLHEFGLADNVLVVRRDTLKVDMASGKEVSRKTRRENIHIR